MKNECKECGTFLEPEFDEWNDREVTTLFGVREVIDGWGIKICRVCNYDNRFIEESK